MPNPDAARDALARIQDLLAVIKTQNLRQPHAVFMAFIFGEDERLRVEDLQAVCSELAEARWRITMLRSALENWGRHHPWCKTITEVSGENPPVCNCGLADVLHEPHPFMTKEWCIAMAHREGTNDPTTGAEPSPRTTRGGATCARRRSRFGGREEGGDTQ